jgi:hypothetical protein
VLTSFVNDPEQWRKRRRDAQACRQHKG